MMSLWTYFKERRGFDRLLVALKNKYISLGRYSGTVEVKNLTAQEAEEFSKFFGQKVMPNETFKTSFAKIEKRLQNTKYEDFSWEEVFTNYFGKHPISKSDSRAFKEKEENDFFERVSEDVCKELAEFIATLVKDKDSLYQVIIKRFHREQDKFYTDLKYILSIIDSLDTLVPTTLPILAAKSGDPHFLDMNTQNNSLFVKMLARYKSIPEPKTSQEKIVFLAEFGIGVDDLSNYVITYYLSSSSGFVREFREAKEPLNLSLHNILKIDELSTEVKKVFVFENPSILSKIAYLNVPIVITSGIPNYAVYKVLDKLSESGTKMFYNGDFDPEGLIIANILKKKYPELVLFCYDEEDYMRTMSLENTISESRIKKLYNVDSRELVSIKNLLIQKRKSGYQENNIEKIVSFISNEVIDSVK